MASNKEIDEKSIELVCEYEKKHGRIANRVYDKNLGYDLLSGGRKIEVKGANHGEVFRGFVIEERQQKNFGNEDFWVYRVLKVFSGNPEIIPIQPDEINLSRPQIRYNVTCYKDKNKRRKY